MYLLTFGSLIGFTAYVYLLAHTTAAKASTYAYVNPVVAVLLGWAIGHETVTSRTLLAAAVILAGVAIITITRDAREPVDGRAPTGEPHPSRDGALRSRVRVGDPPRDVAQPSWAPRSRRSRRAREQRVVVDVLRAADVPLEPRMHVLAGDLARRELDVALGVAPVPAGSTTSFGAFHVRRFSALKTSSSERALPDFARRYRSRYSASPAPLV